MTGAAGARRLLEANVLALHQREPWLSTRDLAARCHTSQSMVVRIIRVDKLRSRRDSKEVTQANAPPQQGDSVSQGDSVRVSDGDLGCAVEYIPCRSCGRALLPPCVTRRLDDGLRGGQCFACMERRRPEVDDLELLLAS